MVLFSCPKVNTGNCCEKCNGCLYLCLERGDSGVMKKKMCFSKKLLIADYVILLLLVALFFVPGIDTMNWTILVTAWIAQLAISTRSYYKKAEAENLIKLPILLLADLPEDMRERADPTQIIASVVGIGTSN